MANISILADSISTYEGYIPSGNRTYYTKGQLGGVGNTWWFPLTNKRNTLIVNNSWSGSRVTNTKTDEPESGALHRTDKLSSNNVNPDIIYLYMGSNDWANNVVLGDFDGTIGTNDQEFCSAYSMVLNDLFTKYPNVIVYCLGLSYHTPKAGELISKNSNGETILDWNAKIKKISEYFGCKFIDVQKTGINKFNESKYGGTHPNGAGHSLIRSIVSKEVNESEFF